MENQVIQITHAIAAIEATSKAGDKEAILKSHWNADLPLLQKVAKLALDPFITFGVGVKSIPKVAVGEGWFDEETLKFLEDLSVRNVVGNSKEGKLRLGRELSRLNEVSQQLLKSTLEKKFATGVTARTINKVAPGTIFLFTIHLAEKFNEKSDILTQEEWQEGVLGELKEDGWRAVSLPNKAYHFVSRNGLPVNSDQALRDQVAELLDLWSKSNRVRGTYGESLDFFLDCELVDNSDVFNETSGNAGSKDEKRSETLTAKVIDILPISALTKGCDVPYGTRREILNEFFCAVSGRFSRINPIRGFKFHNEQEVFDTLALLNSKGKEGLMIKPSQGGWYPKRTDNWLKVKGKIEVDLTVLRLEEGTGKNSGLMGSAVCLYTNSKGKDVEVKIGGGWSLEQRAEFWSAYTNTAVEFTTTEDNKTVHHTRHPESSQGIVGLVIAVVAHEETKDGSLRHPNFKAIRWDKSPEDGQGC